ncbi:MAG: serine hydrolase [Chloroherpetonaceae bacterium]|nr:serine hydrolase [Chloroherpetonaceae bacterium]MDW8436575.1 serine hydrolase [Chloroherpetonaceae bacterium]
MLIALLGLCLQLLAPDFPKTRAVIESAIKQKAFPSATVLVWKDGKTLLHESFGRLTYEPNSRKTDTLTLYDLASLTKPLVVTLSLMKFHSEGKIRLDDSLKTFLPETANGGKERLTLKDLLLHQSGLVAFRRYYDCCSTETQVLTRIYADTLIRRAGDTTIYSDLNFVLLGKVVEAISGKRLDEHFSETFCEPLGLKNLTFNPPDSLAYRIAPTEADENWKFARKRPRVHDPTAAMLGGVSGNAGLFGNASDILRLLLPLLNGGAIDSLRFFSPETITLFTTRDPKLKLRALGWDMRTNGEKTSTGKYFSMETFGHTGFTGTSVWIDKRRNLCVIFLTNRVYPTSENRQILAVRRALHDAVMEDLKLVEERAEVQ